MKKIIVLIPKALKIIINNLIFIKIHQNKDYLPMKEYIKLNNNIVKLLKKMKNEKNNLHIINSNLF